jgi:hypothetical protein
VAPAAEQLPAPRPAPTAKPGTTAPPAAPQAAQPKAPVSRHSEFLPPLVVGPAAGRQPLPQSVVVLPAICAEVAPTHREPRARVTPPKSPAPVTAAPGPQEIVVSSVAPQVIDIPAARATAPAPAPQEIVVSSVAPQEIELPAADVASSLLPVREPPRPWAESTQRPPPPAVASATWVGEGLVTVTVVPPAVPRRATAPAPSAAALDEAVAPAPEMLDDGLGPVSTSPSR